MKVEIVVALMGLSGVALASFLGGLGYYLRARAERLESRRIVLFYLLEIRHAFLANIFEPEDVLKQYLAYCEEFFKKIGIADDSEIPEDVRDLILCHLGSMRDVAQHRLEEEIIAPFIVALNEMAKQAPIMAFRIRGKESLGKLIRLQNKYAEGIQGIESVTTYPILAKVMKSQFESLKKTSVSDLAGELNESIKMVARSCGIFTYLKCRKILDEEVKSEIDFSEMGIDEKLTDFMRAIQAEVPEVQGAPEHL